MPDGETIESGDSIATNESVASGPSRVSWALWQQGPGEQYGPVESQQQSGFVFELGPEESEDSIDWQARAGASSPRPQQQIVGELKPSTLARLEQEPQVRSALHQLGEVEKHLTAAIHGIINQIRELDASILWLSQRVEELGRVVAAAYARADEAGGWDADERAEVQRMQEELDMDNVTLGEQRQRKRDLASDLDSKGRAVEAAQNRLGLGSSVVNHVSYPASAELAEDGGRVPGGDRPRLNFD